MILSVPDGGVHAAVVCKATEAMDLERPAYDDFCERNILCARLTLSFFYWECSVKSVPKHLASLFLSLCLSLLSSFLDLFRIPTCPMPPLHHAARVFP
jgi:hypothetical protein